MGRVRHLILPAVLLACASPGPGPAEPPPSRAVSVAAPLIVGGYECVSSGTCADRSFGDLPDDREYFLTTFDGGLTACQNQADGTWPYIAGKARWGCGTRILVTNPGNGRSCVTEVADCGPNRCVEQAAKKPVIDASPTVSLYLLNQSQAGWSERKLVLAYEVGKDSLPGCPGVVVGDGPDADAGASEDAGGGDIRETDDPAGEAMERDVTGDGSLSEDGPGTGDGFLADDRVDEALEAAVELAAEPEVSTRDPAPGGEDEMPAADPDDGGWTGGPGDCSAGAGATGSGLPFAILVALSLLLAGRPSSSRSR